MTNDNLDRAFEAVNAADATALARLLEADPGLLTLRDADERTLLFRACERATGDIALPAVAGTAEQLAVVDLLLARGADVAAAAKHGLGPLHVAAMTGNADLARRLLAAGAPRTGRLLGASGGSPLALALFYGQTAVAELLADPPEPDNLRTAAALGRPLARFVNGAGLSQDAAVGTDFYRPLLAFPEWNRTNSRQELLDEALTWAARNGRCGAMAELVALGANVNANAYRGTALLWATFTDRVEAATWLLDHGADPNLRHDFGGSEHGKNAVALHLAAQFSCLGCLRLLLARGADTTVHDATWNSTPLGWAEHVGASDSVAALRAHV
ncbi:MAG: ankyrin repeat domain-containing protein [Polyangiaceae bacterium]